MSKIKDLQMKCENCPDEIFSLCDMYTPYEAETNPCSLCCIECLKECDTEKDYNKIEKYMKDNFELYESENE